MLQFFFKKNFYEGWDNVLYFFIPNLIFDAVLLIFGVLAFLVTKLPESMAVTGVIIWLAIILLIFLSISIISLAWAESAKDIVDYGVPEVKEFFMHFKGCIKDGIFYGLLMYFISIITVVGAIYYFKPAEKTFLGITAGFVFCWMALAVFMGLFWFPAMRSLLHDPFKKCIKKCFIMLFDNLGTCIVLGLYNLFLFAISVVMLGIAPGIAGIGLSRENALYLLLKKYDYLDELDKNKVPSNDKSRRKIPWKDILSNDIEATGTRTFKGFFMPWKELEEQGARKTNKNKKDETEQEIDEKWREE